MGSDVKGKEKSCEISIAIQGNSLLAGIPDTCGGTQQIKYQSNVIISILGQQGASLMYYLIEQSPIAAPVIELSPSVLTRKLS